MTGSIPANAGEPPAPASRAGRSRVYPRERGGTFGERDDDEDVLGLSPRTRGNPARVDQLADGLGSIPANAGEPSFNTPTRTPRWVYPRERGGTIKARQEVEEAAGLSPRTRGNPDR